MNFLVGSAPKICCELQTADLAGTTVTLDALIDPDGTDWASSEILTADEATPTVLYTIWQSAKGTHPVGKYRYILKLKNDDAENFVEGSFYLEDRP